MPFSATELEVLYLRAATSSLDEMLNKALFNVIGPATESELTFHTSIHQRFFNVLLVDFLSPIDADFTGRKGSALDGLRSVCTAPRFDYSGTIGLLRSPVEALFEWLDQSVSVQVYLASLSRDVELEIARREFLDICGNISKHNFTRLTRTAAKLSRILSRNKIDLGHLEDLQILEDFYERFHVDILNYHSTALGELLNNVRWGIHQYLEPEYDNSFTPGDSGAPFYTYKYPTDVSDPAARSWYWELMNAVRVGPLVRPFRCNRWLKIQY